MTPPSPLALLAVDPHGLGGLLLRGSSHSECEAVFDQVRAMLPADAPWRRLPVSITDDRLLGGLDLAVSLQTGRRIYAPGVLAQADGGAIILPMAENLPADRVAKLRAEFDCGASRFAIIACDQSQDEASPFSAGLADRLAFWLDLSDDLTMRASSRRRITAARLRLAHVVIDAALLDQFTITALALGIASLRAPILAARAARAIAALAGRNKVSAADAQRAAQLVLAPRATRLPATDAPAAPPPEPPQAAPEPADRSDDQPPDDQSAPQPSSSKPLEELILEAAIAAIPTDLLARLAAMATLPARQGGGAASGHFMGQRGRPVGVRPGKPRTGVRLAVLDTLRAAAPWQGLRRRDDPDARPGPIVRVSDFRVRKFKEPTRSVAIVTVDASGSSALNRLAEAKGAVQLLLAECYVRRDQVALIAFRNRTAEILLPPTSALARARRSLAGLPGGGATPLAAGIDAARQMALAERRRGKRPMIVLLTDGGANIDREGRQGRKQAMDDALAAASACASDRLTTLVIDTAPRPSALAADLAGRMHARHFPLPFAHSGALSEIIRAEQRAS
ncbi:MAG: magnesium chelatase subunit D [Acidiphilium sp.]